MSRSTHVYDKAKYHHDTVQAFGLPLEHACNHTTYFLSWLIKNNFMSEFFESESGNALSEYRKGQTTINELYEWWDCCLLSDMINEEGNAFAMEYFDFDGGAYIYDYKKYLQKSLPSEFHVSYTSDDEAIIQEVIDMRFLQWKTG